MSHEEDKKDPGHNHDQGNGRPLTEDRGMPIVDKAPEMPKVKPPKEEK